MRLRPSLSLRLPRAWTDFPPLAALWLGAAAAVTALTGALQPLDLSLYDAARPEPRASTDLVIVAIDDHSLDQLGPWPWSRAVHAALLGRLRGPKGARVVAFDFAFSGPDRVTPSGDQELAESMAEGPPTVLPILLQPEPAIPNLQEQLPSALAAVAAGLGYTDLPVDPDGLVRGAYLKNEGLRWPSLAQAIQGVLAGTAPHPQISPSASAQFDAVRMRETRMLIPLTTPDSRFAQIPYIDLLKGSAPSDLWHEKIVLIGITAAQLADPVLVRTSAKTYPMARVEFLANAVQSLRQGSVIHPLPPLASVLATGLLVLGGVLLLNRSSLGKAFSILPLFCLAALAGSVLLLRSLHWWWPPASCVTTLLVAYPWYRWRRLETAQNSLEADLQRVMTTDPPILQRPAAQEGAGIHWDFLGHRSTALQATLEHLRDAHSLITSAIQTLPDATLLIDNVGRVIYANPAAMALFSARNAAAQPGTSFELLLNHRVRTNPLVFSELAARAPFTQEVTLTYPERHLLMRLVPFFSESHERVGTLVDLADITALHSVQRERDDLIRFLSHDLKSPIVSLLGLAELQRDPTRALNATALAQNLENLAQRMLLLLDGFVTLTRAEAADPRSFQTFDLRDAVQDAYDEVWGAAEAREVEVRTEIVEVPCMVRGDRHLLARAVTNLLSNAIKFSQRKSYVTVSCCRRTATAIVVVTDRGAGIKVEYLNRFFHRFSRRLHRGSQDPGGVGLGLAFVRAVAEKHEGLASVDSSVQGVTSFRLSVPLAG